MAASQGVDQSEADMSKFNPLFYLEPSCFDAILDEIKKRYGSLESYLENGLAVDGSQVKELQQRLTEQKIRGTTPLTATRLWPG